MDRDQYMGGGATVAVHVVLGVFAWRQVREARRLQDLRCDLLGQPRPSPPER